MLYELVEVWHVKDGYWILIDTWWCENLYETWRFMFINFKLRFYRILFYIASLSCYLFVLFLYLWWSCIYTGANDVTGDKTLLNEKLEDEIILFEIWLFVLDLCRYLKSYEEKYVLKYFKKGLWTYLYYVYIFILIIYTNLSF